MSYRISQNLASRIDKLTLCQGYSLEEAFQIIVRDDMKKTICYVAHNRKKRKIYVGITTRSLKERKRGRYTCKELRDGKGFTFEEISFGSNKNMRKLEGSMINFIEECFPEVCINIQRGSRWMETKVHPQFLKGNKAERFETCLSAIKAFGEIEAR